MTETKASRAVTHPGDIPEGFDLRASQEQADLSELVRRFGADVLRPAAAQADRAGATPVEVHSAATELGLHPLHVPAQLGGFLDHPSAITSVLVLEELGYADPGLAVALLASGAVAGALAAYGSSDQQASYLPPLTRADPVRAAIAACEAHPVADPLHPAMTATRTPAGLRVKGVKCLVPLADSAQLFIVTTSLDDEPRLLLLDAADEGLSIEADPAMGLRAAGFGRLTVDACVPQERLLGTAADTRDLIRRGRLAWSALAVGTCRALLDEAKSYALQRHTFGKPIAQRQSIAFLLANMAIETEGLRLVTWRAAARLDAAAQAGHDIAHARRLTATRAAQIGADGVQILGGHGFTTEFPVERWYRDLRAMGVLDGGITV